MAGVNVSWLVPSSLRSQSPRLIYRSFLQAVPAFTSKGVDNGNLGAQIDSLGRYLKFVDGTYSMGGMFVGKTTDKSYKDLYNTHNLFMNLMFTSTGENGPHILVSGQLYMLFLFFFLGETSVGFSSLESNILCEKKLSFDHHVCVELAKLQAGNDLSEVADINLQTEITVRDESLMSPTSCILYCNGLDMAYALVESLKCVCAPTIKVRLTNQMMKEKHVSSFFLFSSLQPQLGRPRSQVAPLVRQLQLSSSPGTKSMCPSIEQTMILGTTAIELRQHPAMSCRMRPGC